MGIEAITGEIKSQPINNNFSYLDSKTNNISKGSPAGTYATLAALKAAFPSGNNNMYVVTTDGKWYYWNGTAWVAGGTYQSTGIADNSVTTPKLAEKAVDRNKTNFLKLATTNLFVVSMFNPNGYYDYKTGAFVTEGTTGYNSSYGTTQSIEVSSSDSYIISIMDVIAKRNVAFYDQNNVYISGLNMATDTVFSPPQNTKYVRVAIKKSEINDFVFSITFSGYEQYVDDKLFSPPKSVSNLSYSGIISWYHSGKQPNQNDVPFLLIDSTSKTVEFNSEMEGLSIWLTFNGAIQNVICTDVIVDATTLNYNFSGHTWIYFNPYSKKFILGSSATSVNTALQQNIELQNSLFMGLVIVTDGSVTGNRISVQQSCNVIPIQIGETLYPPMTVGYLANRLGESVVSKKRLSILGDSISTYKGYVPSPNTSFYPSDFLGNVENTWWRQLLLQNTTKLNLLVNNSWSGSRVSDTQSEPGKSGINRAANLSNGSDVPDIVIVYLGVNDFNANIEEAVFKQAYTDMLQIITTTYKQATIFCCTFMYNNKKTTVPPTNSNGVTLLQYNDFIREVASSFYVNIIDLEKSCINQNNFSLFLGDGLHPNVQGMSIISDSVNNSLQKVL